jgi:hypothetical protein
MVQFAARFDRLLSTTPDNISVRFSRLGTIEPEPPKDAGGGQADRNRRSTLAIHGLN